jgi:hypothetical protein
LFFIERFLHRKKLPSFAATPQHHWAKPTSFAEGNIITAEPYIICANGATSLMFYLFFHFLL